MSVANVKAKAPKKTSVKKVTDAELAAVKTALEAAPVEYASLSVFIVSQLNARTIPYSAESVESMAATIKSVGLLQNLVAHELPDGSLAVAAGGKRLTALNLLLSQQFLTPDYQVPFKRVSAELAALVSYIENAQRSDMHAAEQIASFGTLAYQGKTPEQIGADLGYSTRHVQRMLKLANLAPSLLKLLADDQLTVEQCQALCLEDDQARQVRVYEEVKATWSNLPVGMLRKLITDKEISITDKRFLFVGRETYEAAGGVVREDLFSQQEGKGTADAVLLETLTVQKLTAMAQDIQESEGWKWSLGQLSSLYPHRDALTYQLTDEPEPVYIGDEESRIDDLYQVADECAQSADDEGYSAASDEIEIIENAAMVRAWTPEIRAMSGVVVGFDKYGDLCVQRGVVRIADLQADDSSETEQGAQSAAPEVCPIRMDKRPDAAEGISLPLLTKMSSERTLAVQAALMQQQKKAVSLLVWQLCNNVFASGSHYGNPFGIRVTVPHHSLTQDAPSGNKGPGFTVLMQEKARLESLLPQGWVKDFTTFFDLSGETLMSLMAFCVACSVDGVQTREYQRTSDSRLDSLENAIGFHMRDWWQPTKANFFADLKHTQIIDSLTEAGFKGAASDAAKMKKGDAAELAEEKMRDTRWVPAWMKGPEPETAGGTGTNGACSDTDNNDPAHAA
ncbi:ParB/RepB/Spo0J family partition protein [Pantoea ananatis]|uniref:ParB/RepB/Spo0J family partition protein n=1 Tax=Pantoea ananas TaxID=553 RepID=UPI0007DADC70|nr:ParB/RepB/Spo0J family partition protein [Pantoea ananatis]